MTNKEAIISALGEKSKLPFSEFAVNFSTMMCALIREALCFDNKPETLAEAYKILIMYDDEECEDDSYFLSGISIRSQVTTFFQNWLNQETLEDDTTPWFNVWNLMKSWNAIFMEEQKNDST